MGGLNVVSPPKACKHEISRTVKRIEFILGTVVDHDPQMCPIVFGDDVTHINEGAGLNVKNLKCAYFSSCLLDMFQFWHTCVV